jgi:hypothetical protein
MQQRRQSRARAMHSVAQRAAAACSSTALQAMLSVAAAKLEDSSLHAFPLSVMSLLLLLLLPLLPLLPRPPPAAGPPNPAGHCAGWAQLPPRPSPQPGAAGQAGHDGPGLQLHQHDSSRHGTGEAGGVIRVVKLGAATLDAGSVVEQQPQCRSSGMLRLQSWQLFWTVKSLTQQRWHSRASSTCVVYSGRQ